MNERAQEFLFINHNDPGVLYYGTIAHMHGLELEGGKPERSYTYEGKPGDAVKIQHRGYWPVEQAPQHWFEECVRHACKESEENYDTLSYHTSMVEAWAWGLGDCIHDVLRDNDTTYPMMRWCTTHIMQKDRDLVFMVPLIECDPYGGVTEAENMRMLYGTESVFVEDKEGQDHMRACHFNGTWVHRTDLVGLERDTARDRIVKPVQQALSDSLPERTEA